MKKDIRENSANRWYFREYPDTLKKVDYAEWKYFNFISGEYSGVFGYALIDPENILGEGGVRVLARIYHDGEVVGGAERFPIDAAHFSDGSAGMDAKENGIAVKGDVYEIWGKQAEVEWKLDYAPEVGGVDGFSQMGIDPLHIEKASWHVEMLRARVRGVVVVRGKRIEINGAGYADANWGSSIPILAAFNWAQVSDSKCALAFGEIQNIEVGKLKLGHWSGLFVECGKERAAFGKDEIVLKHDAWSLVPGTDLQVPVRSTLHAENARHAVSVAMRVSFSDPLQFRLPFSIPLRPIIVEQYAEYEVEFLEKTKGKTRLVYGFKGRGFKEYTLRSVRTRRTMNAGIVIL